MQFNLLNWYGKRKNCPMGRVVSHRDLPAMGRNDRLAQRQPQPHAATAVGNPVRGAVEHVKNAGFAESGMPGPLSATDSAANRPCRSQLISMSEPGGVYLIALSTILMMTCTIKCASICASRYSSPLWICRWCSALLRLMPQRLSHHFTYQLCGQVQIHLPSSRRLTDNRFSTRLMSHMASS